MTFHFPSRLKLYRSFKGKKTSCGRRLLSIGGSPAELPVVSVSDWGRQRRFPQPGQLSWSLSVSFAQCFVTNLTKFQWEDLMRATHTHMRCFFPLETNEKSIHISNSDKILFSFINWGVFPQDKYTGIIILDLILLLNYGPEERKLELRCLLLLLSSTSFLPPLISWL